MAESIAIGANEALPRQRALGMLERAGFVLVYLACTLLERRLGASLAIVLPFSIAQGLAVAYLALRGAGAWRPLAIAAALHLVATRETDARVWTAHCALDVLAPIAIAAALRARRFDARLSRTCDVATFILRAVLPISAAAVVLAQGCLLRGSPVPSPAMLFDLLARVYVPNVTGAVIVGGLLMVLVKHRAPSFLRLRGPEAAAISFGLVTASWFAFGDAANGRLLSHLPLPFLFWAALRFEVVGAAFGSTLLATAFVSIDHLVGGRQTGHSDPIHAIADAAFLLLSATTAFFVAAAMAQRRDAERSLARSMERLQANAERFERVVACTHDVIIDYACEGDRLEVDAGRFRQLTGWSPSAASSPLRSFLERLHPDDRRKVFGAFLRHVRRRQPLEVEYRARVGGRDDGWRHFRSRAQVQLDRNGEPVRLVGSVQDVTERALAEGRQRDLQTQLHQAQKMEALGQLAGGLAHDFNNLLTGMMGCTELLVDQVVNGTPISDPSQLRDLLQTVHRSSLLTRKLLTFSRTQPLAPAPFAPDNVIEETRTMLRSSIPPNIDLRFDLAAAGAAVVADEGQLEQIIVNLALNARDAMAEGGTLTIRTRLVELDRAHAERHVNASLGPHVMLQLCDTGCGMTPMVQSRAFDPFFTTKPAGKGTGLGLSTVYAIVEQLGGHIHIRSAPQQGTTVSTYLPAVPSSAAPAPAPSATPADLSGSEALLLCDDNDSVREFARQVLEGAGYRVATAGLARSAIEQFERGCSIDLLVTDVLMPGMNGVGLANHLRAARPDLHVVFMSGYAADILDGQLADHLGTEFLQKPFRSYELLASVRRQLDARGAPARATASPTDPRPAALAAIP